MASRSRVHDLIAPRFDSEQAILPYSRFPTEIQPQASLIEDPRPDSFFATAQIGDVQLSLEAFHLDRPEMWQGNKNIADMVEFLVSELEEVDEDWSKKQEMTLEAYRAQEVADCLIFMLAMATQLGLQFDQAELEAQTKSIFQNHPRHVSTEFWTKDHEDTYWDIFSQLQSDILWLQQGAWPQRFDELSEEEQGVWKQRLTHAFTLGWALHRLYGLQPTREMLDKIARNMGKYAAGEEDRAKAKKFYNDRGMNTEHFSTQYRAPRPAELGRPKPRIVAVGLPGSVNLLR